MPQPRSEQEALEEPTVKMLPNRPAGGGSASERTSTANRFSLVIGGSAVRPDLPLERKRLEGSADGLTVGRTNQRALHSEGLMEGVLQYVSREHFRVEPGARPGSFQLRVLSSNPVWLARSGRRTEIEKGDAPVPLADNDAVLLFTGAEDCTADGPGCKGVLHWTFFTSTVDDDTLRLREALCAEAPSGAGVSGPGRSPRSPRTGSSAGGGGGGTMSSPRRVAFADEQANRGSAGDRHPPATSPAAAAAPARPPSSSGQVGALKAPCPVFGLDNEEDELAGAGSPSVCLEDDSPGGLDDKFARSGFRFAKR
eukprot:TRINITY_DN20416_c0_g1_i2.p1 TRINITY_DN20416_c0_g1~~TRINITY_DN20416_c0_g1_i2.p1  ORF type:complete len:311 (+),score=54.41 TRINITY_DN20416_c0_g1_i2:503-1435(+)